MNRCYSVLSFLLIVLSFLQGVPAQGRKTLAGQFEQFSIEHGLSQSSVYCLCQDARGFLWAGTGDGLNRFDGYQFKVFRHTDKTENTISGNRVLALAGDNNGSLWVATERGIDEYVASQGKFFHHDFCNSFRKANQPEYLAALYPEFGDNFVFSNASRIFSYNKKSHTVISTELTGIFAIERYDRQSLLIGTYTAIYQMTVDKRGIYYNRLPIALPKRATIRSMHLDRNGMIWIGTMQDGLFSFAPESGKLQQYAKRIGNFPADHVASITAEDRPVLWIGTNGGGLIRFDAVTGHATNYSTRHSGELSSNFITTLLHDNSGTLWIGTDGGGLNKLYEGRAIFREYKPAGAAAFSFKGKFIRAISLSKDGTLYISALENGLYIINEKKKISEHFPVNSGAFSKSGEIVGAYVDRQNSLWIGTAEKLFRFSGDMEKKGSYDIFKANAFLDCGDKLLIGSNVGLFCYHFATGTMTQAFFYDDSGKGTGRWVRALHKLPDGTVAVGTIGNGIALYDPAKDYMRNFSPGNNPGIMLSNPNVISFSDDPVAPDRFLWAGSRAGLNRIDLKTGDVKAYTNQNGLANDYIYGLMPDRKGYLWISTNNGLYRMNVSKGNFKNYDRDDGLQSLEFNTGAEVTLPDGRMLFGGTTGISVFNPDSVEGNRHVPNIVLTEFRVFDRPFPVENDYSALTEITLTADQNIFSFRFAALDLADPPNNQFAYIMEGFEKQWSYCGESHDIRYTGLKPGTYRFRVIGSNNHDVWNENGLLLTIHILPPYWQTWWFRIGGTLFLLSIISLSIWRLQAKKYRKQVAKLERQQEIEKERARIARDMHDEIGAILTRISILTDIEKNRPKENESLIGQIGAASREAVDSIGEIIWAMNPRNDSLEELIYYLRRYTAEYFENAPIRAKIETPETLPATKLRSQARRDLFLFLREALQNVVKHSGAQHMKLDLSVQSGNLVMSVVDDGKGFDETTITRPGNGLQNLRRRAADLHAGYEMKSAPGEGTAITLVVPLSGAAIV